MQFLKNHYEKIILSVVLLCLAGVAAWLAIQVQYLKEDLASQVDAVTPKDPVTVQPVPSARYSNILYRATNAMKMDLSKSNKVFAPQQIKMTPKGDKYRSGDIGANAVQVRGLTNLHLLIEGRVTGAADKLTYNLLVKREYELRPGNRSERAVSVSPGGSSRKVDERLSLKLLEAKGAVGETTEMIVEMTLDGEKETITVSKDKPFKRRLSYAADLFYPPDNQNLGLKRETEDIVIGGETNNIVAIRETEVVLSSNQSTKRTILKVKPSP